MSSVNQQYLKDKDGNNFSPITSASSVYGMFEPLLEYSNANNVQITTSGTKFTTTKSMNNYRLIMINLRTGYNYGGAWLIPSKNFGRNNTFRIEDDASGFDRVYTQGITDTTINIKLINSSHGMYLIGIYGLFPIN